MPYRFTAAPTLIGRICPTRFDEPYPSPPPDYLGDLHFGSLFLKLLRARQVPADGIT